MLNFLKYLPESDRARVLEIILKIPGLAALVLILEALCSIAGITLGDRNMLFNVMLMLFIVACLSLLVFSMMALFSLLP
jgi:hypothetical protein